jgi:hypothetical protein
LVVWCNLENGTSRLRKEERKMMGKQSRNNYTYINVKKTYLTPRPRAMTRKTKETMLETFFWEPTIVETSPKKSKIQAMMAKEKAAAICGLVVVREQVEEASFPPAHTCQRDMVLSKKKN